MSHNNEQVNPLSIINDPILFASSDFLRGLPITDFNFQNIANHTKPDNQQQIILPVEKEEIISPMDLTTFANNYCNIMFSNPNNQAIEQQMPKEGTFIDITPYLLLPQHEAAKKLGIPSSTLSKRWKEAVCNRKWPYRVVSKLDKEIATLLRNVESTPEGTQQLSPHVEAALTVLMKKRAEELKTVYIRIV